MRLPYAGGLAIALLFAAPLRAHAEWHFKPFVGFTFEPSTTLVGDLDFAAGLPRGGEESGSANIIFGGSVVLLGNVFGVEGDIGIAPGFFESGDGRQGGIGVPPTENLVTSSGAQTYTGNFVVALSRRISQYTLRPYVVGGAGLMRLRSVDSRLPPLQGLFSIQETLATIDVGGGATGFFNERVGVGWDLRYFRSVGGKSGDPTVTIDGVAAELSFWRANMALVLRY